MDYKEDIRGRFLAAMRHIISKRMKDCSTVKDFASRIGEYAQNISKMENGERFPTLDHIGSICDVFGISPNWLILNNGDMFIESELYYMVTEIEKRLTRVERFIKMPVGA